MTPKRAKERRTLVKATPIKERASVDKIVRRDLNYVENSIDPNEKFESFFEFEQQIAELAEMPPSRVFQSEDESPTYMEEEEPGAEGETDFNQPWEEVGVEEEEEVQSDSFYTIMEEESVEEEVVDKRAYDDVVGFKFVQCSYAKANGEQCRRQAPKGSDICSIHKRKLEKEG